MSYSILIRVFLQFKQFAEIFKDNAGNVNESLLNLMDESIFKELQFGKCQPCFKETYCKTYSMIIDAWGIPKPELTKAYNSIRNRG